MAGDHATRDHATRDHGTGDHATGDHATRYHATGAGRALLMPTLLETLPELDNSPPQNRNVSTAYEGYKLKILGLENGPRVELRAIFR
eukprot:1161505-Pelagomonas_calceolata.AAC.9